MRLVLRRHARTHWRLLRKGLGSSRYNATKRICIAFRVMGARMPKTARYRLQSLLHARVPWRVIDELEWLRRILPRSCSKPPKRDPIPQIRKKFILGNRIAQPLSCVHVRFCCLACKLMVARIVRLRMSVIREKRHQPPTNPLSLRARNEIDELLLAVHVELPIDIAPMGDGRSF